MCREAPAPFCFAEPACGRARRALRGLAFTHWTACFQFLSHRPRRRCLVFTSQRFTGVTKDVASARPSRPARALRTAAATRRPSGSVLGNKKWFSVHVSVIIEPVAPPQQLLIAFACPILDFKAVWGSCWRHMQCLRAVGEEVEEVAQWFKEELEPCKWCSGGTGEGCFATLGLELTSLPPWIRWWMPELGRDLRSRNPKRSRTAMGRRKAN